YHSGLYRQVESTSVTPFSARARDRALHAVLIGAARLTVPAARADEAAGRLEEYEAELRALCETILDRARRIAPEELGSTSEHLNEIIERWQAMADSSSGDLRYHAPRWRGATRRRPDFSQLLRSFTDDDLPYSFDTMNSMRDVDVETDLREVRR